MRIMGLDVGDVRIGMAISDESGIIARGVPSIKRINVKDDIAAIKNAAIENEVTKIVVGLPKTLNDEVGIQAQKVLSFVESLGGVINIPIFLYDERMTTVSANRALLEADLSRKKRKKVVDKVAAVLILQGYLDSHKMES